MKRLGLFIGLFWLAAGASAANFKPAAIGSGSSSVTSGFTVSNVAISTVGRGDSTNADFGLDIEYYHDHVFKLCGADPAVAGQRLKVYDVSVPTQPVEVAGLGLSAFQTGPQSSDIQGHYLYVLGYEAVFTTRAFVTIDISTPNNPLVLPSLGVSLPRGGFQIRVAGNFAYMGFDSSVSSNSFRIVDISSPSRPFVVAGAELTSLPTHVNGIDVRDGFVYIAFENNGSNAIRIIDVRDPYHPVMVNSASGSIASEPRQIVLEGKYAYTGSFFETTGLMALDLSTPTAPVMLSTTAVPNPVMSIYAAGRYVFVGMQGFYAGLSNCQVFDVSDPRAPVLVKSFLMDGTNITGFAGHGRYVYISGRATAHCLYVVDMGAIDSPAIIGGNVEAGNLNVRNRAVFEKEIDASAANIGAGGVNAFGPGTFTGGVNIVNGGLRLDAMRLVGVSTPTVTNEFRLSTGNGLIYSTGTANFNQWKRVDGLSLTGD